MRLLMRVLLVFIVVSVALSIVRGALGRMHPLRTNRPVPTGRLVKDPVCGTYIPEETALRGGDQFFCSPDCLQQFEKGDRPT